MNNQELDKNEEEEVDHQLTVNSLSGLLPPIVQRADTKETKQKTKKPPKTQVNLLRITHVGCYLENEIKMRKKVDCQFYFLNRCQLYSLI